jgi:hypothetical protein
MPHPVFYLRDKIKHNNGTSKEGKSLENVSILNIDIRI